MLVWPSPDSTHTCTGSSVNDIVICTWHFMGMNIEKWKIELITILPCGVMYSVFLQGRSWKYSEFGHLCSLDKPKCRIMFLETETQCGKSLANKEGIHRVWGENIEIAFCYVSFKGFQSSGLLLLCHIPRWEFSIFTLVQLVLVCSSVSYLCTVWITDIQII